MEGTPEFKVRKIGEEIEPLPWMVDSNDAILEMSNNIKELAKAFNVFSERQRPSGRHAWFQTGRTGIDGVATEGQYNNYDEHNFLLRLGYPAREATIQNFGPGKLFVAIAETPTRITPVGNEIELGVGSSVEWTTDDGYEILRVYLRSDDSTTEYQILAG